MMTEAKRAVRIENAKFRGKARAVKVRGQRAKRRRIYRSQNKGGGDGDGDGDGEGDSGTTVEREVFTISEFCYAHHISEAFYYKLRLADLGPVEVRALGKVTISREAAAAWRRAREAAQIPVTA